MTRRRPVQLDLVRAATACAQLPLRRSKREGVLRARARHQPAPAPSCPSDRFMAMCQERSPTKLAKIGAPARGRGGAMTYPMIPRPASWSAEFAPSAPRTAVGINEYPYPLSQRRHGAVKCSTPTAPATRPPSPRAARRAPPPRYCVHTCVIRNLSRNSGLICTTKY